MSEKPLSEETRSEVSLSQIDILVEAEGWEAIGGLEVLVQKAVSAALASAGKTAASISLLLGDDAAIQRLNASFRGKDKPTNVLSFPRAGDAGGSRALAWRYRARL